MKRYLLALILAAFCISGSAIAAQPSDPGTTVSQDKKKKTETVVFKTNMHCKNCVKKINENIAYEKGVKDLKVSLEDNTVTITYDPAKTNPENLEKALRKLGYEAEAVTLP